MEHEPPTVSVRAVRCLKLYGHGQTGGTQTAPPPLPPLYHAERQGRRLGSSFNRVCTCPLHIHVPAACTRTHTHTHTLTHADIHISMYTHTHTHTHILGLRFTFLRSIERWADPACWGGGGGLCPRQSSYLTILSAVLLAVPPYLLALADLHFDTQKHTRGGGEIFRWAYACALGGRGIPCDRQKICYAKKNLLEAPLSETNILQ